MTVNSRPNPFEFSEADTCREYVTPAIQAAGWGDSPFEIADQRSFTVGRIVLTGRTAIRRADKQGVKDYISLTNLLRGKDGGFFVAGWISNRNTFDFLGG
jgi:hypothetical protein